MCAVLEREIESEPVLADEAELPSIHKIDDLLASIRPQSPKLVGPKGEQLPVPTSVCTLLKRIVHELARGNAVTVVPMGSVLTTQEAADLLKVSRPFLVRLLEAGEIPFYRVGTHRRIRFTDLMEYRRRRERTETEALDEMARIAQEAGLYE